MLENFFHSLIHFYHKSEQSLKELCIAIGVSFSVTKIADHVETIFWYIVSTIFIFFLQKLLKKLFPDAPQANDYEDR